MLKQKKENKLSTEFQSIPYEVTGKHGDEVSITSLDGVSCRRNVTDVKKYRSKTNSTSISEDKSSVNEDTGPVSETYTGDSTGDSVPSRPVRNKKLPAHLKDYELYSCST